MKQKKLAILGASGHGKVVADAALNSGWEEVLFFDDAWPDVSAVGVWPVVGGTRELLEQASCFDGVVVAIGSNATRLEKQSLLEQAGVPIATIVHPSAIVSAYSDIGKGSVLFAGVVVNAFSTTGRACILNTSATVDHDCLLGDAVHVSPGAHLAGGVVVGQATWIGIGASVIQGINIGSGVMVGAGAAVVRDIDSRVTVAGVPARQISPPLPPSRI